MPSLAVTTFERVAQQQGATVLYGDGTHSVELTALFGRRNYQVQDSSGALIWFSSHDVLLVADALILNGSRVEPRRGHTITRILGDRRHTFLVHFPDATQPPWRWSDPGGEILRIHTTLLSDEVVT